MILRRYIQKEIAGKLGWILGLLLLILSIDRFVGYLADAALGQLPGDLILQMLMMRILASLPKLMPVAVFIAVILGLSRLVRDQELTIIRSAGLAFRFQLLSLMRFVLAFASLVFILGFYVAPWAEHNLGLLKARARAQADIAGMKAGKFKEFSAGDRVLYTEQLAEDANSMQHVFLQVRQNDTLGVLHSKSARYEFAERSGSRYIRFQDGRRYIGSPGELDYQITRYRAYAVLIEAGNTATALGKLEATPSAALLRSSRPGHVAELQWRLSLVLAVVLLPVLGLVLSRYAFSDQRYLPVVISIAIYFLYSNLLGISKTLVERDQLSPYLGLWWVHVLLILISVLLFYLPDWKTIIFNASVARRSRPAEK